MGIRLLYGICLCFCLVSVPGHAKSEKSDSQIKQEIINESVESYPGNCACPYHHAGNGSRCGGRSAYSRAGGYHVICYAGDVSDEMIRQWKQEHAD